MTLHGPLSGEARLQAYRRASIFCFPTQVPTESFGLVALEAMQHGLPVVASNWRAIPEIVRDGETGLLFPPGDAARMAVDVDKALHQIIEKEGGKTPEEAAAYVEEFKKAKRYRRDVY